MGRGCGRGRGRVRGSIPGLTVGDHALHAPPAVMDVNWVANWEVTQRAPRGRCLKNENLHGVVEIPHLALCCYYYVWALGDSPFGCDTATQSSVCCRRERTAVVVAVAHRNIIYCSAQSHSLAGPGCSASLVSPVRASRVRGWSLRAFICIQLTVQHTHYSPDMGHCHTSS